MHAFKFVIEVLTASFSFISNLSFKSRAFQIVLLKDIIFLSFFYSQSKGLSYLELLILPQHDAQVIPSPPQNAHDGARRMGILRIQGPINCPPLGHLVQEVFN